jgi:hypothetical protein
VPGDSNDRRDIFVVNIGATDSDGDQMDDEWEIAYFGTLARDGTDDADGDGSTDKHEFFSNTNPMDGTSAFRVLARLPNSSAEAGNYSGRRSHLLITGLNTKTILQTDGLLLRRRSVGAATWPWPWIPPPHRATAFIASPVFRNKIESFFPITVPVAAKREPRAESGHTRRALT